jgi:hypothetical protein
MFPLNVGRGNAETEANETNDREGPANDPALDARTWLVGAAISERLGLSKTSVATYLLRAREAGLSWPLPPAYESDAALAQALFRRLGRPPEDLSEPDWPYVAQELKRKGVTLTLLWQEYRATHPDGYGYTWFCPTTRRLPASSASDVPPLPRSGRGAADRIRRPDDRGD